MNKRRIDYIPQPRELLEKMHEHLLAECSGENLSYEEGEDEWIKAAFEVEGAVKGELLVLPPDPPRRSYYGKKGSLTNPFH